MGGIPLLMGAAVLYFTSGMTFRCDSPTPGQVTCAEGRRLFKLFDMPVRRYTDVRGAVTEKRKAYDADGNSYERSVTVILTGSGRTEPLPAGEGVGLAGLAERVDDYAKHPTPAGLRMAYDPGYAFFSPPVRSLLRLCGSLELRQLLLAPGGPRPDTHRSPILKETGM